jgi:ribosome-associated toxin RatA of RatAB toxin-antitoxin module
MPIVEEGMEISGTPGSLFELSQDVELRLRWDPFPQTLQLLGGATRPAVGVRVGGRSRYGVTMEVVYVSFNPPRTVAMKMVRGPKIFRGFAGTWSFRPGPPGRTRVTFRYWYELRRLPFRSLLSRVVAWRIRRDIRARLRGLKRGAEEMGLIPRTGRLP